MRIKINALQSCLLIIFSLFFASISLAAVPDKDKTQVDLNTATEKELATLPGVGASTARNIIAARPFKNVEDLEKVKGIGKARYGAIKDKVTAKPVAAAKPATASAATTGSAAKAPPVNINTANLKTLETLPGIGTATAKNIVAARPFKKVEDLEKVKGVGKAKYDAIKDKVTIKTVAAATPAKADAGTAPTAPKNGKLPVTAVDSEKKGKGITKPEPSGSEPLKALPVGSININTADQKTLEALPGIGPVKAKAIIDHRPYTKVEDVMKVPGIKEGTFAKIKDQIVVK